ncbi:MAG: alpha-amylase family glycosyl hydrolase [Hymenobacter sp.]
MGLTFDRTGQGTLRVWAPTAEALRLRLYVAGAGGAAPATHAMQRGPAGTWQLALPAGTGGFYTGASCHRRPGNGRSTRPLRPRRGRERPPRRLARPRPRRARRLGRRPPPAPTPPHRRGDWRGERARLVERPAIGHSAQREISGLDRNRHRRAGGVSTGLQHLQELGITHLHLLPVNDFAAIDEALPHAPARYSWGYDPLNYFVPEGSYATDALDPAVRIREYRELVQALHQHRLAVVADVVFNHVANAARARLSSWYRVTISGTMPMARSPTPRPAATRWPRSWPMVRKLIVDAVSHWARAYHVDGFRFDLMGVLDVATMRAVRVALDQQDHGILVYGEGWRPAPAPCPKASAP